MNFPQLYIWLCIGIGLLLIEALGFTGFFLGMALAALLTALYAWLMDPVTIWSSIWLFAPLAVALTWAYWRFFRGFNSATDAPRLNRRGEKLVGTGLVLEDSVGSTPVGHFIGDTRWQLVSSGAELAAGTAVVVQELRKDGVLVVAAK